MTRAVAAFITPSRPINIDVVLPKEGARELGFVGLLAAFTWW